MDGETIAFDILLMDEQGRVLVEIERFAQKRVNDPAEQIRALAALIAQNGAVSAPDSAEPTDVAAASREIRPLEGAEALARILAHKVAPQVVVSVRDLYASIRFTDEVVQERAQQANPTQGESVQQNRPKFPRPQLATAFAAPRDDVEQQIAEVWQDTLGIEQVGIQDNFFELGGDSLVAIELVTRLSRTLGTTISPVSLFEGPTVGALRDLLRRAETESAPTFETSKSRGERRRAQLQRRRES
jgi:acyl carrier protein